MDNSDAVVLYLCRSAESDVRDLIRSLSLLRRHYLSRFPHPVIVFVEPDFRDEWKSSIWSKARYPCRFETVQFAVPDFVGADPLPESFGNRRFSVGYRHMCRFFSGTIYGHPSLKRFRWYWRLDTDSLVLSSVKEDVFEVMARGRLVYGYNCITKEAPEVAEGLWTATQHYLRANGIVPTFLDEFVRGGEWDLSMYYTNFEVSDFEFWRSREFAHFFEFLDRTGGIYRHRWGDAAIHLLAVAIFVPKEKVHRFRNIHYRHQGFTHHPPGIVTGLWWIRCALLARWRRLIGLRVR